MPNVAERVAARFLGVQRVANRFRAGTLTHLGTLPIGQTGSKAFGGFVLTWEVMIDHVAWEIDEPGTVPRPKLTGALKYVGWNRFEIERGGGFEVFCHDWPHVRDALNFVYYEIGPKIALAPDVADGSWTDPDR